MLHRPQFILIAALVAVAHASAGTPRNSRPIDGNTKQTRLIFGQEGHFQGIPHTNGPNFQIPQQTTTIQLNGPSFGQLPDQFAQPNYLEAPSTSTPMMVPKKPTGPRQFVSPMKKLEAMGRMTELRLAQKQQQQPMLQPIPVQQQQQTFPPQQTFQQQPPQQLSTSSGSSRRSGDFQHVSLFDLTDIPQQQHMAAPYLPTVPQNLLIHKDFMLLPPHHNSVLAADQATDYVVAFFNAYAEFRRNPSHVGVKFAKEMHAYVPAIGYMIDQIEKVGYQHMDLVAAKVIKTRVSALKVDIYELSLLATDVPGLQFNLVQRHIKEGAEIVRNNKGWFSDITKSVAAVTGYVKSWMPRRVTPEQLQEIRQRLGRKVVEQQALIVQKEPVSGQQMPVSSGHSHQLDSFF